MRYNVVGLGFFSILLATSSAMAFDFAAYEKSSLPELLSKVRSDCAAATERDREVNSSLPRFRIAGVWSGKLRPVSPALQDYLDAFKLSIPFEREIELVDGGASAWLAIQAVLELPFKQEVAPNSRVTLFVTYFGCERGYAAITINEFSSGDE